MEEGWGVAIMDVLYEAQLTANILKLNSYTNIKNRPNKKEFFAIIVGG